jgi:thioredoxin-related protein
MTALKKYVCLIICIIVCTAANAQKVNFITNGNLRTAFDLAKAQNKKVFLEVYAPDCHTCQLFEPIFADKKVAQYYNEHFISYRLDANNIETHAFLQKQKVSVLRTPTFLFYGNDVKLIHEVAFTEKQNSPGIVLSEAEKAVTK